MGRFNLVCLSRYFCVPVELAVALRVEESFQKAVIYEMQVSACIYFQEIRLLFTKDFH